MLAQIEIMQIQIRQLIVARIHYCDQDLAMLQNDNTHKKRVIAKRRDLYRKELVQHMENIFQEHKRNKLLSKRAVLLKFLEVSYAWRVELNKMG